MLEINWVKTYVQKKEWDDYYKYLSSYSYLGMAGIGRQKRVKLGFLIIGLIPHDCEALTDEEIFAVDQDRRTRNVRPFPTKEIKKHEDQKNNSGSSDQTKPEATQKLLDYETK